MTEPPGPTGPWTPEPPREAESETPRDTGLVPPAPNERPTADPWLDVWSPPNAPTTPTTPTTQTANPTAAPDPQLADAYPVGTGFAYADVETLADAPSDTLGREVRGPRQGLGIGWLIAIGVAIALIAGGLGGGIGAWVESRQTTAVTDPAASLGAAPVGTLSRRPDSVAGIAQRVLPTVVSIDVTAGASGDTGSGFVLRSDGYILTNNHVVAAAAAGGQILVQLNNGTSVAAAIVGRSPTYDLAVLKIRATGLPVATLGNSDDVVVGDVSIAVGSPLGLAGTVTSGIISAKNRPVATGPADATAAQSYSYISALQTDAAINPGNSGGPLVNDQGQVVGVNSAIASLSTTGTQSGSIGVGFAIPINQARAVAQQLIRLGYATYPVIGVDLDPAYTGSGGRIAVVAPGGPAGSVGLAVGDVIVAVDNQPVTSSQDVIVAIREHRPGERLTVRYRRGASTGTAVIVLGAARG